MQNSIFQELTLSRLGFGTMRLPLIEGTKTIDEAATAEMVDLALAGGVNYFDTAFPYHGGMSEIVVGKCLARHPRESWHLATKYPGHQIADSYDPKAVFEKQLKKCGVEYFDFYLLHNVCESSIGTYLNPQWGIIDYFREQKRLGRIRHLGFSSHGRPENLRAFLDACPDMEFCQIQLNYLDWELQDAKTKYGLLTERNIPVWVMEPVRGGKLAKLPAAAEAQLRALRPEESIASWGFRWVQSLPNVKMVLSGMSNLSQMQDNLRTFSGGKDLSEAELALLAELSVGLRNSVPCTACRYCCDGCPAGLDIPTLLSAYNDTRFSASGFTVGMLLDTLPAEKLPTACLGCGKCAQICPQKIDVPAALADFAVKMQELPSWKKICAERAAAAKKL